MNSFGLKLSFSSFGESHGPYIGVLIDGLPAGLLIDLELLQSELYKRQAGGKYKTKRVEKDEPQIISGLYKGRSTGAPVAVLVANTEQRSKDYDTSIFRPAHADFTYYHKYKNVDLRGGGRASARESVARVIAGAFAKMLLKEFNIFVEAGLCALSKLEIKPCNYDFAYAKKSELNALDPSYEKSFKKLILKAIDEGDSLGAAVFLRARGLKIGLGEPLYDKLSARLAFAIMSINAVKALEFGLGIKAASSKGSENNDSLINNKFQSNNSGGLLGGLSNGDDIRLKVYFKPTPSIYKQQDTMNIRGENVKLSLKGRHDPCVGIRGCVVVEAMCALVLADALLLDASSSLDKLKKIYE